MPILKVRPLRLNGVPKTGSRHYESRRMAGNAKATKPRPMIKQ